jgi:hypothetical protein
MVEERAWISGECVPLRKNLSYYSSSSGKPSYMLQK